LGELKGELPSPRCQGGLPVPFKFANFIIINMYLKALPKEKLGMPLFGRGFF